MTNHITGGEGGGQAGQRVAYGCSVHMLAAAGPSLGREFAGMMRCSSSRCDVAPAVQQRCGQKVECFGKKNLQKQVSASLLGTNWQKTCFCHYSLPLMQKLASPGFHGSCV